MVCAGSASRHPCIAKATGTPEPGGFSARDRLASRFTRAQPGETAFVLSRTASSLPWRYAGLAHWSERDGAWTLPEPVDDLTWKALGTDSEHGDAR